MRATHILVLSLIASTASCTLDGRCIADCDTAGAGGSPSATSGDAPASTGEDTPTSSGGDASASSGGDASASSGDDASASSGGDASDTGPGVCEGLAAAEAFLEANGQCSSVLDCVLAVGSCYQSHMQGPLDNVCGQVGLSVDADLDAWAEIDDSMTECGTCATLACETLPMCTDRGECRATETADGQCESYQRDAEAFVSEHRACETDDDCVLVDAVEPGCYLGNACGYVALNNSADLDDWRRLLLYINSTCPPECPVDDCAPRTAICSPAGTCEPG